MNNFYASAMEKRQEERELNRPAVWVNEKDQIVKGDRSICGVKTAVDLCEMLLNDLKYSFAKKRVKEILKDINKTHLKTFDQDSELRYIIWGGWPKGSRPVFIFPNEGMYKGLRLVSI